MTASVPASSLESLRIFPLPATVLFPGTTLPLHIFEERYRAMTRDALAGDGLIAIALLEPSAEVDFEGCPPVADVVGVGKIVGHRELPDGRYYLLLQGVARARIERELPLDEPYRRVQATLLDDERSERVAELTALHAQLGALFERLTRALGQQGEALDQLDLSSESPSRCADLVLSALVSEPAERQRLLATLDPADRLDAAVELVARIARQVAGDDTGMLH